MSGRELSPEAIASQNAEQTGEAWLVLVEINHEEISQPIRVSTNNENVTSGGNVYLPYPFEVELPGEDPERPISARLRIDNVDRVIVNSIRSISSPPEVTFRVVLASDPDVIEVEYTGLKLRDVFADANVVEGELTMEQITIEPIATTMNPSAFPGLF